MGNTLQAYGSQAINEELLHRNSNSNNQIISELTCQLCIEPFSADKSFNNNDKCSHPFCLDCIAKYIQVKLEDNVSDIPCPDLNCNHLLDPLFCRQYVSKPIFDKWCDLLCDSAVLRVEQRCYCPNRNCSALVLNECRPVDKAKCPNCKKDFCFKCQIPWHAGFRCDESGQQRDKNDVLFGIFLERRGWRRCPNCGQCVQRNQGCRIIRCRCMFAFCYYCGKSAHLGHCESKFKIPYYTCGTLLFIFMALVFLFLVTWGLISDKHPGLGVKKGKHHTLVFNCICGEP